MKITRRLWGSLNGAPVFLFELRRPDGICVNISNYGGVIQSVIVPDRNGTVTDVVLGYDTLEEYINSETYFGAMVGPVVDRIENGTCTLDGREIRFPLNAGPDFTHSGAGGFHCQLWNWQLLEDGLSLQRTFTEAGTGFPGPLHAEIICRIPANDTLRLEYIVRTERETAVSITNHSYFSLNGGSKACLDHLISVKASRYAETRRDSDPITTGRTPPVETTPFDLRAETPLREVLRHTDFPEIRSADGLDHYFPVDGEGFRTHASLCNPESGLTLTCRSDAPGVLIYAANGLSDEHGKNGMIYGRHYAVCLETEAFPNGINLEKWRGQVLLPAGETRRSVTEFTFRRT